MSGFCKPIKTAKGMVAFNPSSELALLNMGLKSCDVMGKLFASSNSGGYRFVGVISILLDGKTARRCQAWQSTNKAHRRVGLKEHASQCLGGLVFTVDENRRQELFQITGISPDNKFGIATSVSILNSCASKKNWASYGRDATSEEVAFCKTRKTVQYSATYEIEARQFRASNGSQEIMMTIGWQRAARLDLKSNTRIKQVVMKYTCGNKSFARMRKNPRGTAVACIKDMLGLVAAPRGNLNAVLQNQADRMDKLGGYTGWGTNRAEEKAVMKCMGNLNYIRPECRR